MTVARVRHVRAGEHERLRAIRLAALAADPASFGATHAADAARPAAWWRRWAEQSEDGTRQRTFVLAGESDRWLGLALVRRDDDRPAAAVLNAMWVAPEARGGGARMLCDACAGWAAERGVRELTLTVLVDNLPARRAYEAAGFSVRGTTTWAAHGRTLAEFIDDRATTPRAGSELREYVMARAV